MRFLGAKVVLTPAPAGRHRHGEKAVELAEGARLVPHPPVRERGERRHALPHHRAGDPRRLRGRAARLLGHRLRHGRHAEGRRARAARRSGRRRRSCSASPRMHRSCRAARSRSGTRTDRRRAATRPGSRIRFRAGARTSFPSSPATPSTPGWLIGCSPVAGPDAMRLSRQLAPQGRNLRRHLGRGHVRRRAEVAKDAPKGLDHTLHAAGHRRALSHAHRCSPTSRPT